MKYLRATIRLLALKIFTAGYYLLWLAGLPFVFASPEWSRRWRARNFRNWACAAAFIISLKVNVHRQPPPPPFLLVSNHLSYVDIITIATQVDCIFVAKSEVAQWPFIGLVARTLGTIFIDRKQKSEIAAVMAKIDLALKSGLGVVLFAEGTSTGGASVSPFRSSLLELAAREHLPVHYASISYEGVPGYPPAHLSVCWWGEMTFPRHVFQLLQLPTVQANLVFGAQPVLATDRKLLASELWTAVNSQFTPMVVGK